MTRVSLQAVISSVVAAGCIALLAVTANVVKPTGASTAALLPPTISPSGPIISVDRLRAGESRTAEFTVTNPNAVATDLMMTGLFTGGDTALYDVLTASVAGPGHSPIWSGRLRDLDAGASTGSIPAGDAGRYVLTVAVPSWAGDDLQSLRSEFDMRFTLLADGNGATTSDTVPPVSSIGLVSAKRLKRMFRRAAKKRMAFSFAGTANDSGSGVARMELALVTYVKARRGRKQSKRCRSYVALRRRFVSFRAKGCQLVWFSAQGTTAWRYRFPRQRLKPGRYELRVRALDAQGNVEQTFRTAGTEINMIRFVVKK